MNMDLLGQTCCQLTFKSGRSIIQKDRWGIYLSTVLGFISDFFAKNWMNRLDFVNVV